MRNVFLVLIFTALTMSSFAQKSALTTAILARDAQDYVKAKNNIDQVVQHESTKIDPKAWYYRGLIYQELAQIQINPNGFFFNPLNGITEADINEFMALSDEPVKVAIESYKECLNLDIKKKHVRNVDANLRDVLAFMAYNKGGIHYEYAIQNKDDKSLFMNAYNGWGDVFKIIDLMTEESKKTFIQNLAKELELDNELLLVRLNMANAAFYAENYSVAQKDYEFLVEKKLDDVYMYRNLAYIYKQNGDVEAQRKLWDTATDNFDGSTESGKALALEEAVFYQEIGELEILVQKLENAINLDPSNSSLYNVLGGIYTQKVVDHNNALSDEEADQSKRLDDVTYRTYFDKAESLLKKAQELNPTEATNFTQLGSLYLSEGLVSYNANQRLSTSKTDLAKSKVLTEKYKASFSKSQKEFESGLAVDSENRASLEYLSKIHIWSGDLDKSIEYKNRLKALGEE